VGVIIRYVMYIIRYVTGNWSNGNCLCNMKSMSICRSEACSGALVKKRKYGSSGTVGVFIFCLNTFWSLCFFPLQMYPFYIHSNINLFTFVRTWRHSTQILLSWSGCKGLCMHVLIGQYYRYIHVSSNRETVALLLLLEWTAGRSALPQILRNG
jgi:hypothetical protein